MRRVPSGNARRVQIEAHVYEPRTLFMRVHAGHAIQGDKKWEMSTNVAGGAPIIRVPDGRWVTFNWQALIDAANEAVQEGERK